MRSIANDDSRSERSERSEIIKMMSKTPTQKKILTFPRLCRINYSDFRVIIFEENDSRENRQPRPPACLARRRRGSAGEGPRRSRGTAGERPGKGRGGAGAGKLNFLQELKHLQRKIFMKKLLNI